MDELYLKDQLFIRKEIAKNNLKKIELLSKIYILATIFIIGLNTLSTVESPSNAIFIFVLPLLGIIIFNAVCIYIIKSSRINVNNKSVRNIERGVFAYILISFIGAAIVTIINSYYVSSTIFYSLILYSSAAFFVIKSRLFAIPVLLSAGIMIFGMYYFGETHIINKIDVAYFFVITIIGYLINKMYNQFFISTIKIKLELMKENVYRKKISKDLKEANRRLMIQNAIDPLTNLQNRTSFNNYLETLKQLTSRTSVKLTAVMIDIDCFKHYNDFYGHAKGDEVISSVGKIIFEIGEKYGVFAARYGGEEFILLIQNATSYKVNLICEELMNGVAQLSISHEHSDVDDIITISIGAESVIARNPQQVMEVIDNADKMLYRVKRSGRNAYLVSSP